MTPEDIKTRHEQSVADYPGVNLSEHEFVIAEVRRHYIGLVPALLGGVLFIGIVLAILFNYAPIVDSLSLTNILPSVDVVVVPGLLLVILAALWMYIAYYIYMRNFFILTNESVIENIQYSLIAHREQSISLGSVEDSSYVQEGVLQYMLNYGSIRMSTVGDENTYRFRYVANPKAELTLLSDAVENFKNNRPVAS